MAEDFIIIENTRNIAGEISLSGAKNAVLVIMISLLLTDGKSTLKNVPDSADVAYMIKLLEGLGAKVSFDHKNKILIVDTSSVNNYTVDQFIMQKMRASILVLGPLLAKQKIAEIALPGGDVIGKRPVDYHLDNFRRMGAEVNLNKNLLVAIAPKTGLRAERLVLEYPSVGATENLLMGAVLASGITEIINAALEPEVLDLITVLRKMGASIDIISPATIKIIGVQKLSPIEHTIINDRLEAGSLLLAAAVTNGEIYIDNADPNLLDVFLFKLEEMGHKLTYDKNKLGIKLVASKNPKAVSFKSSPYPGFPTDLQAPMMVAQCCAFGDSLIEETVYENRLIHVRELQKMGAQIKVMGNKASVTGVDCLYGSEVVASDIRAAYALVLAGFVANGRTIMSGVPHFRRGYDFIEKKLQSLGAKINICSFQDLENNNLKINKII